MNQENTVPNLQTLLLTLIQARSPQLAIKCEYAFQPDTITCSYLIKYADWNIRASRIVRRPRGLTRAQHTLDMAQENSRLSLTEYNTEMAHQMFAAICHSTRVKS
ncbi:hypothetical protein HDR63_03515 [bacterium]|nr:hypothetical protein [bacterium]